MKKNLLFILLFTGCLSRAQSGTEIILLEIKSENGHYVFANPVNITQHKGYDNQPYFHPSEPLLYFSSFNEEGRSDIKIFNYKTGKTTALTETGEREYSPTVTPDGKFISCIIQRDNGAQDLGKYPLRGGKPEIIINHLTIGYHTWLSNDWLALFVLGDPNTLHLYNLITKSDTLLAKNIGRSLQKIPGENAFSYVQNISESEKRICKYDASTGSTSPLANTLNGQDHFTWLDNHHILMGERNGLYLYNILANEGWKPVPIEGFVSEIKEISRVAVNANKTKLAVVVNE